jgi:hypothetical protein
MAGSVPVTIASDQSDLPIRALDQETDSVTTRFAPGSPALDAFHRQRVSMPVTIFDSKLLHDAQPLFWDDAQTSGAGTSSTYNTNQSSVTMAVSASTAGRRVRQTFRRFNYQPGKSLADVMTGVIGEPATGITRRVGSFDESNGVFFESAPSGVRVVVRSKTSGVVVDTPHPQASWNVDKLDGTGPSGIDLDFSKAQIFFMDLQWLGAGTIRFGFDINKTLVYCHDVDNAGANTTVYMSTPNLPLRYEIANDGTGGVASLTHICGTVISEGGRAETGLMRVLRRTTALTTSNDANLYPLLAIRLKSGYLDAQVIPKAITLQCSSNATYSWALILNPTVAGTALSFTSMTNSPVEYDVSRTNATTVTGGTEIDGGVTQNTNEGSTIELNIGDLQPGSKIDGTAQILVLAVQRLTGTSESFYATMQWNETV